MAHFPRLQSLFPTLLAVSFLVLLMSPISQVFAASQTKVSGMITYQGNLVTGANVTASCSNGNIMLTTSNSKGHYSVTFGTTSTTNCPNGDTVTVTGAILTSSGHFEGHKTGTMSNNAITINVALRKCPRRAC